MLPQMTLVMKKSSCDSLTWTWSLVLASVLLGFSAGSEPLPWASSHQLISGTSYCTRHRQRIAVTVAPLSSAFGRVKSRRNIFSSPIPGQLQVVNWRRLLYHAASCWCMLALVCFSCMCSVTVYRWLLVRMLAHFMLNSLLVVRSCCVVCIWVRQARTWTHLLCAASCIVIHRFGCCDLTLIWACLAPQYTWVREYT